MKQEICRIVSGYDIEAEENRWWEARLITTEGEQVIDRVDYIDERYRDRGFLYNFSSVFSRR